MDMLAGKSCVEIAFPATGQIITQPGPFTHTSRPEELLFQLNKFFFVVSRKGAVSIFIVAALLKQKHCAVSVYALPYIG